MKLLTDAQKQLAAAGKDVNDDAYRDLQREIAATAQKLAGYNTQLKNAQEMQKKPQKKQRHSGIRYTRSQAIFPE